MTGLLQNSTTPRKGLLGLGGISALGGSTPPAGLLGPFYDPAEERRRKIFGAMSQAGIELLRNGRGNFGEVLGQGLAGAVQGANNAGQDYRQDAMGYQQLAQQQKEQGYKDQQRESVMKWLSGLPPDQQALAEAFPEKAAEAFYNSQKPSTPTDDMREYAASQADPKFGEYLTGMKRAGATNLSVDMKGENAYAVDRGKGFAKRADEIDAGEQSAFKTLNSLNQMENLIKEPSFYSGLGAEGIKTLKQMTVALGGDPNSVNSMEQFNTLSKQTALDVMGGSLGTGFSNADRDFVVGQVPNLQNTPQGNAAIIAINRKMQERKIEIARMARDYELQNGRIDAGFMQQLAQWAEANPLFKGAAYAPGNNTGGGTNIDGYTIRRVQ